MNPDLSSFPWPPLPGSGSLPRWGAGGFELDGAPCPVLCYDRKESNWTEDLTEMHEQEAGRDHPIDLASRRLAREAVRRYCSDPRAALIEVGSSSGYLLEELRAEFPSMRLIGSDFIAAPLERLAPHVPTIPLLQFDLRECPLPSGVFDGVILLNVLEHIDDDRRALGQAVRILKPGGLIHVEVPANPDCYDIYDEHLMHHRRYRLRDLTAGMRALGLEILKATHLGFFIYPGFLAVKWRNRRLLPLSAEKKKEIVASQIRGARAGGLLAMAMRIELLLGKTLSFPFGARCLVTARKPSAS